MPQLCLVPQISLPSLICHHKYVSMLVTHVCSSTQPLYTTALVYHTTIVCLVSHKVSLLCTISLLHHNYLQNNKFKKMEGNRMAERSGGCVCKLTCHWPRNEANGKGLLILSIESSLWAQVRWQGTSEMMKDAQVLNVNATKFKVLLHVSEREEQSEAWAGTRKISQRAVPFEVGLDTMLDCIELTKETL